MYFAGTRKKWFKKRLKNSFLKPLKQPTTAWTMTFFYLAGLNCIWLKGLTDVYKFQILRFWQCSRTGSFAGESQSVLGNFHVSKCKTKKNAEDLHFKETSKRKEWGIQKKYNIEVFRSMAVLKVVQTYWKAIFLPENFLCF